ncbi:MAG TPA: sulfurtransferase TusA family protein [Anaeromyxobacteraceae bacterium]|nr:sulfurtransferase TusA family protein [Anaeromyxobacteraceae bacterium]
MSRLDLRPYVCPLTWVKTRIALERLEPGERLEVLLAEGQPLDDLPRTAEEEGHRVVSRSPAPADGAGAWSVVLEKGSPRDAAF